MRWGSERGRERRNNSTHGTNNTKHRSYKILCGDSIFSYATVTVEEEEGGFLSPIDEPLARTCKIDSSNSSKHVTVSCLWPTEYIRHSCFTLEPITRAMAYGSSRLI